MLFQGLLRGVWWPGGVGCGGGCGRRCRGKIEGRGEAVCTDFAVELQPG